ncbi:MAG: EF-P lysine aminoacylase EpmA [Candidatus Pacebacteria bacterium]|nr:EF-P lysine aminoacylase EpmA [Candidatus Paceibacterota bacterium]
MVKNWEKISLNPEFRKIQIKRGEILNLIREFFVKKGFLECQTPTLVKSADESPYLSPFKTFFKDENNKTYCGYLITSPEYSLKKLLPSFNKIFELARVFRGNESFGGNHNPEFTMLEWYRKDSSYLQIMKDTEELILFLNKKINHSNYLKCRGEKINLKTPWKRLSVKEAFLNFAKINLDEVKNIEDFKKKIKNRQYFTQSNDWNDLFYLVFLNEIEPRIPKDKPIIIYDYPLPQAALAKKKTKNSFYAERFEVFIAGMELANAFSELTDAKEQFKRFKEEKILRKNMKKDIIPIDKDLIKALELNLPPCGGIALGVERLQMLLLDISDINDLLPFPAKDLFNE